MNVLMPVDLETFKGFIQCPVADAGVLRDRVVFSDGPQVLPGSPKEVARCTIKFLGNLETKNQSEFPVFEG